MPGVTWTQNLGQGSWSRENGSCGLAGAPSTEEENVKRSDLKQLRRELAPGYELVPVPRRLGRWFVQAPGGELVKLNPDRSDRPMVLGGNTGPGTLHLVRSMLAKAGCLR